MAELALLGSAKGASGASLTDEDFIPAYVMEPCNVFCPDRSMPLETQDCTKLGWSFCREGGGCWAEKLLPEVYLCQERGDQDDFLANGWHLV